MIQSVHVCWQNQRQRLNFQTHLFATPRNHSGFVLAKKQSHHCVKFILSLFSKNNMHLEPVQKLPRNEKRSSFFCSLNSSKALGSRNRSFVMSLE